MMRCGAHKAMTQPCHAVDRQACYGGGESNRKALTMKTLTMKTLISVSLTAAVLAGPAAALEPLSGEKYINDRLIAARIADKIRRGCDNIDGRIVYAWGQARALKKYAETKGYSKAQIDAFLDSDKDKARIYGVADDYLRRHGATDEAGLCALGRDEIAKKTVTGSLLRAR